MLDPITLAILAALTQIVVEALVRLAYLTFVKLTEWFLARRAQVAAPHRLAFTVAESLRSGDYTIVQGIFDQYTGALVGQPRRVRAGSADPEIVRVQSRRPVVVWT